MYRVNINKNAIEATENLFLLRGKIDDRSNIPENIPIININLLGVFIKA
jgi:hypothetical protein